MKIAVINFSGNVGKSTVAHHLLAPRLEGAQVIPVESINSDDSEKGSAMRGKEFGELQDKLMTLRHAVVDIGSHEDFDAFVVPTVPALKQQVDTISTLRALTGEIGVPADRIRVVFNTITPKDDVSKIFSKIFDYYAENRNFVLNRDAVMYENPIYEKIKAFDRSIIDLRNDPTDYVAMNAEAMENGEPEEHLAQIRQLVAIKRLATRVTTELDAVFKLVVH
jgi:MinD-like ATPase involved in chromosome partitioning or flagellar assembly